MVMRKIKKQKANQKGGSVATKIEKSDQKEAVVVVPAPVDQAQLREKTRRALFQSL